MVACTILPYEVDGERNTTEKSNESYPPTLGTGEAITI